MRNRSTVAAALVLALACAAAPAASAAELEGVSMPDHSEAGGQSLVLNGLGLREKFFVNVYVAGLYLPAKQTSEKAILGADTPRHVVMHFQHDATKQQICDGWGESLEANRPNAGAALEKDFDTLCSMMADIEDGEEMAFTYVPGTGTAVWWERLMDGATVFGIPQVGMLAPDGTYMENTQLEPDVLVYNSPESVARGEDSQLAAAVELLLEELGEP